MGPFPWRGVRKARGRLDNSHRLGLSRLDTDNARPNNQYRLTNAIADIGWSPDTTLPIRSVVSGDQPMSAMALVNRYWLFGRALSVSSG